MALVLLGRDHPDKQSAVVRSLDANGIRIACGLTAGEGPSRNPKEQPNEDSLGVVAIPGGVAAVVADSHWGGHAGEKLVELAIARLERSAPTTAEGLHRLMAEIELELIRARPSGDASETTLLIAIVRPPEVVFASVADSFAFKIHGDEVEVLNGEGHHFAGSAAPIMQNPQVVSTGSATIEKGDLILLASDGIAVVDSGIAAFELPKLVRGAAKLEDRVRGLIDRARSKAKGGGRDNVALVAMEWA